MVTALRRIALVAGAIWIALAAGFALRLVPLGALDLLLLLAPLVAVPLGLALVAFHAAAIPPPLELSLPCLQIPASLLVAASFFFEPGRLAALLVIPWLAHALLVALWGVADSLAALKARRATAAMVGRIAARLLLPVGAAWLLLTRSGTDLMGYGEPITELTAVHFHFTAFAATLLLAEAGPWMGSWLRAQLAGLIGGIVVLATGFNLSLAPLKTAGAVLIAAALIAYAIRMIAHSPGPHPSGRILLGISSCCVLVGMGLAVIYAAREMTGPGWPSIPEMIRWHGVLNGIGFTLCGLLGWSLPAQGSPGDR